MIAVDIKSMVELISKHNKQSQFSKEAKEHCSQKRGITCKNFMTKKIKCHLYGVKKQEKKIKS